MRIAFVITRGDSIGGAQVHVRDLATALARAGNEVHVMVGHAERVFEALPSQGVQVHVLHDLHRALGPLSDAKAFRELRKGLRAIRPAIVSTHSSKAGVEGRIAAASLGIPVIFTAHGWSFSDGVPAHQAFLYRNIERGVSRLAARVVTVSDYDRELAIRWRIAAPGRLETIHNGMPDVPSALRAVPSRGEPRIVMVGRFQEQKDHRTLLTSLGPLRDRPWQLDLVGDGPMREEVRQFAAELGLSERVNFLGERSDVAEILAAAQLFVLSSNWEGFPRSILEAMRAGLPVVSSDVGGCRESVQHEVTGFLVGRKDARGLSGALAALLYDAGLRVHMGNAGRERFVSEFSFGAMYSRTLRLYESVLAGTIESGVRRVDFHEA